MGSGQCIGIAPEHFVPAGTGRTSVRTTIIDADDAVLDAAACCPAEAITVREVDSGRPAG
jgi:ferredoxin